MYTYGVRNASFCLLLWGQKRFLLPVILNPFTLRVTGIKTTRKNAIAEYLDNQIPVTQLMEYLDYQIPVTQLYGDMQAAKRD